MATGKSESYWKDGWSFLIGSFKRLDRRFFYVMLLEFALVLALFFGYYLLTSELDRLAPQFLNMRQSFMSNIPSPDSMLLEGLKGDVTVFYRRIVAYFVLFGLFALAACSFFKLWIYTVVNKKRLSLALYWRFLLVGLAWSVIFLLVFYLVQVVLAKIFMSSIATSLFSKIFVMLVTVFVLLVLFYLTVSLLTTLTLTCKIKESVKTFARGLKRIHHSLRPVVFQFLIFIIINLFIFVFAKLPIPVFVGVTAIMLLAYFAWLRFYDTMVWHKMATSVVEDKPKISAGSKVIKHSVKKKQAKDVMGSFVR